MLKIVFIFVLFFCPLQAFALLLMNRTQLNYVRANGDAVYDVELSRLFKKADLFCKTPNATVMNKKHIPASGSKHDYMSLARYSWPNPNTSNGLPYISKDGKTNPEINEYDRNEIASLGKRMKVLTLAWFFSGRKKYSEKAVEQLRTWFIDETTRMNPNLSFAQIVPGTNNGYGNASGVIDSYTLILVVDCVLLLKETDQISEGDYESIKKWFRNFTDWMVRSVQGRTASNFNNNISVIYETQLLAYKSFALEKIDSNEVFRVFEDRIVSQIDEEGKQLRELKRTNSYHYSQFNLIHLVDYVIIAKNQKIDVLLQEGMRQKLYRALDFLSLFLGENRSFWQYRQDGDWHDAQMSLCETLYRVYNQYDSTQSRYNQLCINFYEILL